jgi:hypothetical protein
MGLSIDALLPKKTEAWVTFAGPFEVLLEYTDQVLLNKLLDYARTTKGNVSLGVEEEYDENRFIEAYCTMVIKDWRGIDDSAGIELECSIDNKRLLMQKNPDFRNFVQVQSRRLKHFVDIGGEEDKKKLHVA